MTTNSDYKKYSLENLDNWMHDAMSSGGATPQEIYDVIINVVKDNYYTYKQKASEAYELLTLLNGNGKKYPGCYKDDSSPECKSAWNDFWEEYHYPEEHKNPTEPKIEDIMPPWGHSDMEALRYTEEEMNAMCEKAASDEEKEKCREYNLREAEYYDKRANLDAEYNAIKEAGGYEWTPESPKEKTLSYDEMIASGWTMTADGFWIKGEKKRWVLPVEEVKDTDTDKTDYFVSFPDDLLEAADLKEGDQVQWIDNGDGSYTITKVTKPLGIDEC